MKSIMKIERCIKSITHLLSRLWINYLDYGDTLYDQPNDSLLSDKIEFL